MMKFWEIYEQIIHYWPEDIVIDDGTPGTGEDGHYFPSLSKAWNSVESKIGCDDPWLDMMVWTTFQEFHAQAMEYVTDGQQLLNTRAISRSKIEQRYFNNLHSDEWHELLSDYERVVD